MENQSGDQKVAEKQPEAAAQTPASSTNLETPTPGPRRQAQQQRLHGIVSAVLAVLIIVIVIWNVLMRSSPSTPAVHTATPAAPVTHAPAMSAPVSRVPATAAATPGHSLKPSAPPSNTGGRPGASAANQHVLAVRQIVGKHVKLSSPEQAFILRTGSIAVADTGGKRLVILKPNGAFFRSTRVAGRHGHIQFPFSLVAGANYIYVVDPKRDTIDQYTLDGVFVRVLVHNYVLLGDARGIGIAPNTLYVANPRGNDIVAIAIPSGAILRRYTSRVAGPANEQFDQPTGVAVSPDGKTIYVVDTGANRVKVLNTQGGVIRTFTIPPADTVHPNWLVLLPDGRLVLSSPLGALYVYPTKGRTPRRYTLTLDGRPLTLGFEPQGISVGKDGLLLVADRVGNRLLAVSLPK